MTVSSGVGLYSGINIDDTVTKLMDIEKRPVTALQTRIDGTNSQKTAFSSLSAQLLKLQSDVQAMYGDGNVFTARSVTSSNPSVLTATADKDAAMGSYSFTVKSLVQSHQMISGGYSGLNSTIGAGTLAIEPGSGRVDKATLLDGLNGGAGISLGHVLIADRSGASAQVDLTGVTTVQDVLDAINTAGGINVRASVSGDHIVLTDATGQTASDLVVREVNQGSTAASLGILGDSASGALTGSDIVAIGEATSLASLNDGRGVSSITGIQDFQITRKDGTSFSINVAGAQTVGDVLQAINSNAANADGKLVASISGDGKAITLTDSTGGPGSFTVAALNGSTAAADLGILGTTAGAALTGGRIVGGLNTALLKTLNGGTGVTAGSAQITNHAGASATVDLSSAQTLSDVITAINASGLSVTASYSSSHTGLVLTDASTGSGAFSVAEAGSTTAADLKIAGSTSGATITGADLHVQYVSGGITLDSLNGGKGIDKGTFRITDRSGVSATVDLSATSDIADLISNINTRGTLIRASINATGDGILLTDTSGGSGTMTVTDETGTAAADLRIAGSASSGDPTHIDGSFETKISILSTDTLQMIAAKINSSGALVAASVVSTGSGTNPYRLSLVSQASGAGGEMVIDTGGLNLNLSTTQQAKDAVVIYGQQSAGSQGMLVTSRTNSITGIVSGLTLNLQSASPDPVTVSVTSDDSQVTSTVSNFVNDWNSTMSLIQSDDSYDTGTQKAGVLFGDSTLMQIESRLNDLIMYAPPGNTSIYSRLNSIGVSVLQTGKLSFDQTKLETALGSNRDAVEKLFSTADTGLGAHFYSVLDGITNDTTGTIKHKNDSYDAKVKVFQTQIDSLGALLADEQTRLYNQFYAMENALANLASQKTAIDSMVTDILAVNNSNKSSSG